MQMRMRQKVRQVREAIFNPRSPPTFSQEILALGAAIRRSRAIRPAWWWAGLGPYFRCPSPREPGSVVGPINSFRGPRDTDACRNAPRSSHVARSWPTSELRLLTHFHLTPYHHHTEPLPFRIPVDFPLHLAFFFFRFGSLSFSDQEVQLWTSSNSVLGSNRRSFSRDRLQRPGKGFTADLDRSRQSGIMAGKAKLGSAGSQKTRRGLVSPPPSDGHLPSSPPTMPSRHSPMTMPPLSSSPAMPPPSSPSNGSASFSTKRARTEEHATTRKRKAVLTPRKFTRFFTPRSQQTASLPSLARPALQETSDSFMNQQHSPPRSSQDLPDLPSSPTVESRKRKRMRTSLNFGSSHVPSTHPNKLTASSHLVRHISL